MNQKAKLNLETLVYNSLKLKENYFQGANLAP